MRPAIGALPMQKISSLIDGGFIINALNSNIQSGSLDLTLSSEGYRVRGAFLPAYDETVRDALKRVGAQRLHDKAILENGSCYVYLLKEHIQQLPTGVYSYSNPKSSSGRLDIHVRLLADRVSRYDKIPELYSGPLWVMISPKKLPVVVAEGITLLQARFFNGDTRFSNIDLELNFGANGGLLFDQNGNRIGFRDQRHSDADGSVILTLGLNFDVPGFEVVETGEPIEMWRKDYYDPEYFFRTVIVSNNAISLSAHEFYILSSREFVRVPENFACEMVPMDEKSGELRSHYAGFIDPGWGIGRDGSTLGRPLTLEVRSFDSGLIIQDGQPITKIRYEKMTEIPELHYDEHAPTYALQYGPKLSKHFKEWRK
ncbi:MAG TPA: 2'-deoxycytidine 5'-triphosphate deaminase [Candidatus Paceibacterota bacterium]